MTRKVGEKKEYSMEIVETAENLYIYKNKTYEEISKLLDVPVVTLQRWGGDEKPEKGRKGGYGWRKKKLEQIRKRVDYRHTLYVVRDDMLEKAKGGTDPQIIHGLAALQKLIDSEEKISAAENQPPDPEKFLVFMKDMVVFLKDRDPVALAALEKNFDEFIQFAKSKYAN